jgi:hypothetical protein
VFCRWQNHVNASEYYCYSEHHLGAKEIKLVLVHGAMFLLRAANVNVEADENCLHVFIFPFAYKVRLYIIWSCWKYTFVAVWEFVIWKRRGSQKTCKFSALCKFRTLGRILREMEVGWQRVDTYLVYVCIRDNDILTFWVGTSSVAVFSYQVQWNLGLRA